MIDKKDYHKLKKYIRTLCRLQVRQLCIDAELNDFETKLFLASYDNQSVVKTCMNLFISNSSYTNYIKIVYSKVFNYLKFANIKI